VAKAERAQALTIGGVSVQPGERRTIELPLARVFSHADLNMVVQVVRGRRPGPVLCVSAGVHGDELNGVEIVRRLRQQKGLTRLRGTLVAVPVVNMFGFIQQTRYLPDQRDLNRCFPGSSKGSLAARLADLFMNEVMARCDYGIDLHTAAVHRRNLAQVRGCLSEPRTLELARAFGSPVLIDSNLRDGSLRGAARDRGIPMLVYEAGEALRMDEVSIRAGMRGITSVMRELGMLPPTRQRRQSTEPVQALGSSWLRAGDSGLFRSRVRLGARVRKGDVVGVLASPFGGSEAAIHAHTTGIVIGMTQIPLLNEGDAACHIAEVERPTAAEKAIEAFHDHYLSEDAPA
jgi:predicted deacylase